MSKQQGEDIYGKLVLVVVPQGVFRKFWHAFKPPSVTLLQATSKNNNLNRNDK